MMRKCCVLFACVLIAGLPGLSMDAARPVSACGSVVGQAGMILKLNALYVPVQLPDHGFLDLDVKPEDTEVFIDGKLMGMCDQFDGNPGYLYLKSGKHLLTFKREGYLTFEREIEVNASVELEFNTRMQSIPRADGQIAEREPQVFIITEKKLPEGKSEEKAAQPSDDTSVSSGESPPVVTAETLPDAMKEHASADERGPESEGDQGETIGEGTVMFRVFPVQAAVYIDDIFVGISAILNEKQDGLTVSAGTHRLDLVAPGYQQVSESIIIVEDQIFHLRAMLVPLSESATRE